MSVVDEVKQSLDIVDVIGSYVDLKKAGRSYKGLCPFHTEKTPSFIVFPESQSWHCFGACSTGGDVFSFIMRQENMDFGEALRTLAERAGIELRPLDTFEREQRDETERLRAANAEAAQFYHRLLLESPRGREALAYLERRGVTRETIGAFQLGYAPDEWHLLDAHLKKQGMAQEDLLAAGLLSESERGAVYDRFRGRLMFPIRDIRGHVIGFGGRVLDDGVPKYLNTPQTPLFDKGSLLYGIDLTSAGIRDSGTAIIVEGYMDVIVPYQCGVTNVVACMGTALSEAHIKVLKRMTNRLVFALDPDAAGIAAVQKGVDVARQAFDHTVQPVVTATGLVRYEEKLDAEIRVMVLPEGLDPDELVLRDRARWDQLEAEALPVADYFFQLVENEVDLSTAKGKRTAADRLVPVIAAMDSPVERTHYLQRLARRLHVDERTLLPEVEKRRGESRVSSSRQSAIRRGSRPQQSDRDAQRTFASHPVAPPPPPPSDALDSLPADAFDEVPPDWSDAPPDIVDISDVMDLSAEPQGPRPQRRSREGRGPARPTQRLSAPAAGLESHVVALLLHEPSLLPEMREIANLTPDAFEDTLNRSIYDRMLIDWETNPPEEIGGFVLALDTESREHVESLLQRIHAGPELSRDALREDLLKCSTRLHKTYLSRLIRELRFVQQDEQERGDRERLRELNEIVDALTRDYLRIEQRFHAVTLVGRKRTRTGAMPNHEA